MANINKDEIKQNLTIEQVESLVAELGGEPQNNGDILICRTICHGGDSHKLYYYSNTQLFRCYTECNDTFDIFDLVCKVKAQYGEEMSLFQSVLYVIRFFNLEVSFENNDFSDLLTKSQEWEILNKYTKINSSNNYKQKVELNFFDSKILTHLPHPHIVPWEQEGISRDVMEECGICYNPKSQGIVIPHYDIDGNLIGIRERTLIQEEEEYGKYKPSILNNKMYNHPLAFALYNLNNSKENIKVCGKAVIFEGEKSTLLYRTYFGADNDISCACCGSSLIQYQVDLLLSLGVKEIIVGFDKQFKELGDEEFKKWTAKLTKLHEKYSPFCQISFLFDKWELLDYKDSPIDKGAEAFMQLFKERVML